MPSHNIFRSLLTRLGWVYKYVYTMNNVHDVGSDEYVLNLFLNYIYLQIQFQKHLAIFFSNWWSAWVVFFWTCFCYSLSLCQSFVILLLARRRAAISCVIGATPLHFLLFGYFLNITTFLDSASCRYVKYVNLY